MASQLRWTSKSVDLLDETVRDERSGSGGSSFDSYALCMEKQDFESSGQASTLDKSRIRLCHAHGASSRAHSIDLAWKVANGLRQRSSKTT